MVTSLRSKLTVASSTPARSAQGAGFSTAEPALPLLLTAPARSLRCAENRHFDAVVGSFDQEPQLDAPCFDLAGVPGLRPSDPLN